MQSRRFAVRAVLATVLATALATVCIAAGLSASAVAQNASAPARPAGDELLRQILQAVARQPLHAAPFIERRMSALASKPLESRGTLSYEASGKVEKLTTNPIRERVVLSAESIEISSDNAAPTVIRFASRPELAGYAVALRALLAAQIEPLRAHFDVRASGSLNRWQLTLLPIESTMKRAIRQISISGDQGQLRLIETTELGGDIDELTLLVK